MRLLELPLFCLLLVVALLGATDSARARDTVVLLESGALRPDLCVALRIQLTDVADVRCRTEPPRSDLAQRIAAAAELVSARASSARERDMLNEPVRLVVLLERDPDGRHVRMLLVGSPQDRAVLAVESIEDRPAPDVDRSLALKVRDTLDVLDTRPSAALAAVIAPAAAPLVGVLELGPALAAGAHVRAASLALLGLGARRGAAYGELALGVQRTSSLNVHNQLGRVVENEWGLALALRVGRAFGPLSLGALGELGLLRVHALGVTRDGSSGDDRQLLTRLGVGLDLRVALLRGPTRVLLRCAPTLQVDPRRQRFELDGQRALDLGRVHAWLPLTLLLELPFRKSRAGGHDA